MSTSRRTWQKRESFLAKLFGSTRKPGSGSFGRDDETRSDSKHDRLFLESKLRASSATWNLWDGTKLLAKKEKKTPVLGLAAKGRPGILLVVHSDDFEFVAREFLAANAAAPDWATPTISSHVRNPEVFGD